MRALMPPDQRAARVAREVSQLCAWTAGELLGPRKIPDLVRHRAVVALLVQELYALTDSQAAATLRKHPQIMRRARAIVEADHGLRSIYSLTWSRLSARADLDGENRQA